jgi:hypothetical protein
MWLHADTDVGSTNNRGTGLHGDQLANSHTAIDPESPWVGMGGHWIQSPDLRAIPWPSNGREPLVNPFEWLSRFEAPLVVSDGQDGFGVMTHDGWFVEMPDAFGPSLKASLDASKHWVSPAEPQSGVGSQNPVAGFVLSSDGTRILDAMRLSGDGGRLLGASDIEERLVDGVESAGWGSLVQSAEPLLPARSDFLSVYSRHLNRLFVLGGEDASGKDLHDLWVLSLEGGVHQLQTSIELGKVTAATYSYTDRSLYVLDELKKGHATHARLLRIDAMTGSASVIGTWPTFHFLKRQWLVADRDGGLLVVGTRKAWPKATTIVRIDVQTAQVTNVMVGSRPLAVPPIVDRAGYGLLWENRKGGGISYERRASLDGMPGKLQDVGRCF